MTDLDALLLSCSPDGRDFERLCKFLLETGPEYRTKVDRVWLWKDWPGRWGADAGIDLVARTVDGELWAIQAKQYDRVYAIKKADIDSFLSESARPEFAFRLLIATTDHIGRTARRTLDAQEKPVGVLLRSDLHTLGVEWPASLAALRPARPRRKRPLPHQRRAVRACARGFVGCDRGQVVMACGTGKTLVGCFLAGALRSRRTLVLVPSLSLVKQTLREWLLVSDFDYLAVCSDETVVGEDAVVARTTELGVPVTTDPEDIATFLRRRSGRPRVVFATYQSSPRIADAQAGRVPAFDLVIADEAHRCAGPEAGVFATVLDARKIKGRHRLFMTATPRYFTGRVRREAHRAEWDVASMDDESRFGPVLHRLTFAKAIEQGLLSDYRVSVVGVSDEIHRQYTERAVFVTTEGNRITDARTLGRQIGLLRAIANYDLRRLVTFHSRIKRARDFASSILDVATWLPGDRRPSGDLWAEHVSGEMTSGERETRLNRLRELPRRERGILTNARCLSEGVDVPTLDGIAFIDPRRSQIDVIQAVGRAIRKAPDKATSTIVIPVFIDQQADPESLLEASEFSRVWEVVRALRDHDDELAEELDELRRELGRRGTLGTRPGKIVLDIPVAIGEAFARAFDSRLVEVSTTTWEEGIGAAEAFRAANGNLRVPPRFVSPTGFKLGMWITNRRQDRKRRKLSDARVAELDALDMVWEAHEENWQRGLEEARAYEDANGHLRVPQKLVTHNGFRLGPWITNRRVERKRGELSATRIAALDALGMVWEPHADDWRRGIRALRTYRDVNGHVRVPLGFVTEDGLHLGRWLDKRRHERKRGDLPRNRSAELDALGMVWDPQEENWQRALEAARAYKKVNGHLRVPLSFIAENGVRLGTWLDSRRQERRRGELPEARIADLDALGMVWDPSATDWQRGLEAARSFRDANGHLRVPRAFVTTDGFRLGTWIGSRRQQRRRGALPPERVADLDALGMAWDPHEENWQRGVEAARTFQKANGHLLVPDEFVTEDGFRLGQWIGTRRQEHNRGRLAAARTAELESLGMVWAARPRRTQPR
jgi:superfamily II DNA or RNA helicase